VLVWHSLRRNDVWYPRTGGGGVCWIIGRLAMAVAAFAVLGTAAVMTAVAVIAIAYSLT
jgi:hypothetical protein